MPSLRRLSARPVPDTQPLCRSNRSTARASTITWPSTRFVRWKRGRGSSSVVPREVELEAVPADWGPSLTRYRYIYSGERVMLVDPQTRTVVQEVE
ncbi:DUF1236 domain-containing protein [Bradyrhizobium sp. B124]|uniref:DUF1236 domain-containing protein n=1 Tax=Bradyrhizobium sp. B124 TaxID=3140245 RepID=UPI0031835E7F